MGIKTRVNQQFNRKEQNHEKEQTETITSGWVPINYHMCCDSLCKPGKSVQLVAPSNYHGEKRGCNVDRYAYPGQGSLRGRWNCSPFPHHDC